MDYVIAIITGFGKLFAIGPNIITSVRSVNLFNSADVNTKPNASKFDLSLDAWQTMKISNFGSNLYN